MTQEMLGELASHVRGAGGNTVALTGAGISVPSGIPDFRSPTGIWSRWDPADYAHIAALERDPEEVWRFLWELDELLAGARPNAGHVALAELEAAGWLRSVITQNPDGLHQRAGSTTVHEIHGTGATLSCLVCDHRVDRTDLDADPPAPPTCHVCGGVLRPDVTFFGESLPEAAIDAARADCAACHVLLVVGTSAEVEPAATLPRSARDAGATIWEINPDAAQWLPAHHRLAGRAEEILPLLTDRLTDR